MLIDLNVNLAEQAASARTEQSLPTPHLGAHIGRKMIPVARAWPVPNPPPTLTRRLHIFSVNRAGRRRATLVPHSKSFHGQ